MGYHDSMNMYQAFNQNPVNFVDPMGKEINPRIVKYFSSHTKAWDYVKFLHSTYINCQGLTPYDAYKKLISKGLIAHSVGTESYLAFRPSLSIFDVTPAQFGKDVGTGFLNFCADQAYELGRGSHLRHRCNTTVFVTDIDKLVLDELDKSNERVTDTVCETYGGRKNSLGHFVGYVYGPTIISGFVSAYMNLSIQTQFTENMLPPMPRSKSNNLKIHPSFDPIREPDVLRLATEISEKYPNIEVKVGFKINGYEVDIELPMAIIEVKSNRGSGLQRQIHDRLKSAVNPEGKLVVGYSSHSKGMGKFSKKGINKIEGAFAADKYCLDELYKYLEMKK